MNKALPLLAIIPSIAFGYNPFAVDSDGDNRADAGDSCVWSVDGDLNHDCMVNFSDLGIMKGDFFRSGLTENVPMCSSQLLLDRPDDGDLMSNYCTGDVFQLAFFGRDECSWQVLPGEVGLSYGCIFHDWTEYNGRKQGICHDIPSCQRAYDIWAIWNT